MAGARIRLRAVRFKNGGEVRLIRPAALTAVSDKFDKSVRDLASGETHERMAGFALVAWTRDGVTYAAVGNSYDSGVLAGGEPQFVKEPAAGDDDRGSGRRR